MGQRIMTNENYLPTTWKQILPCNHLAVAMMEELSLKGPLDDCVLALSNAKQH